jgi:AAA15 family ATPase/GTPase
MLIEFSVSNFRSVVDRQTLSMVAGSSRSVRGTHSHETGNSAIPRLLKTAAILGPNGAGKSTIVTAMQFMRDFVINSARNSQEGEEISVEPFLFSNKGRTSPSEFQMIFLENGTRYQYGFAATKFIVVKEWLYATPPGGRTQKWFDRHYDEPTQKSIIKINQNIKGEKEVWKKSTRDNALFLSVAIQLNSPSLLEPFEWFTKKLGIIRSSQRLKDTYSARICQGNDKNSIISFMRAADINIADVRIEEKIFSEKFNKFSSEVQETLKTFAESLKDHKIPEVYLGHLAEGGETVFLPLSEESDGTKVLFSLAGPWFDILQNGRVLVVDELHNSLHPLAFEMLVRIFQDVKQNKKFGQLIFTTHETHFLSQNVVHRDGVWMVKLEGLEGSKLTPLSDFKARGGEAFDRGYLGGRYGSIPNIAIDKMDNF